MTKTTTNLPAIDMRVQMLPEDIVSELAEAFDPQQAVSFVRRLDEEMGDWEFSDLLIAYAKELEDVRAEAKAPKQKSSGTKFIYWAKTSDGQDIKKSRYAANVGALVSDLKREGLIVINVELAQ